MLSNSLHEQGRTANANENVSKNQSELKKKPLKKKDKKIKKKDNF